MLQYIRFKDYKKGKYLYRLWNREYGRSYPISASLFKERLLEDVNFDVHNSYVALYERIPIGFILVKKWQDDSLFYAIPDTATISLFYVEKDIRNMGVGTELLELAMNGLLENKSLVKIQLGNDLLNFFPGLPSEFNKTTPFLINRGFKNKENYVDMIQIVKKQIESAHIYVETEKPLRIRIATEEDKDLILRLCLDNDLIKEAYLLKRYFEQGGTGRRIVLGLVEEKIVGFVRIYDKKNKREVLWDGNPDWWARHAPILFPFVGTCYQNQYHYKGDTYSMTGHGFARDKEMKCELEQENQVVHSFTDDEETRKNYPFSFCLKLKFLTTSAISYMSPLFILSILSLYLLFQFLSITVSSCSSIPITLSAEPLSIIFLTPISSALAVGTITFTSPGIFKI